MVCMEMAINIFLCCKAVLLLLPGGGSGQNVRTYGLACDQLISLNMVDYNGKIIKATKTSNADLLWASCGGGGKSWPGFLNWS